MWTFLQPRKKGISLFVSDLIATMLLLYVVASCLFPESLQRENYEAIIGTFPWLCLSVVASALLMDLYHTEGSFSRYNIFLSAAIASVLTVIISGGASYFLRYFAFPRSILLMFGVVLTLYFYCSRFIFFRLLYKKRENPHVITQELWNEHVERCRAIVNEIAVAQENPIAADCLRCPAGGINADGAESAVVQDFQDMNLRKQAIVEALKRYKTLRVEATPADILLHGGTLISRDGRVYIEVSPGIVESRFSDIAKRIFDLSLALVALIPGLALMALIATAIWLDSGSPILYSQDRISLRGKTFRIYKFRTMIPDAEKETGPTLATEKDPRLTRVGAYLRRWRMDELPQLFNVIKGEMSLVGPRPERPNFVREFSEEIPEYELRHLIPPGITGMAQIYGRYSSKAEEKLIYDLFYSRRRGPVSDLILLIKTIKVVMQRDKAM
ncbi:hypothetical protein GTO91_07345 [Heliobacterium undosum]|uniref:Bacterial sugar transferase domain-containing protein n=1 Tax=Heliomicrobium undosum TaxID=121734 RepID=A0A845L4F7_9FIRM|nr:sugar transferase [Heliomicrobium undosum]MZP29520.1 hypothetical protein [Heliomicrobium undosum]